MSVSVMSGFLAWFKERFPFVAIFSAFLIYILVASLSKSVDHVLSWKDFMAAIAVTGFFLLLRVLDEYKDYQYDRQIHPERVLQRGLVTLSQLRFLGIFSFIFMLALSWWTGRIALTAFTIMMIWVALMYKEFFIEEWLKKRLFFYGVTHSFVLVFLVAWCVTLSGSELVINKELIILMSLIFLFAMGYEITRKAKGRDEIKKGEQNYTEIMSPLKVAFLTGVISIIAVVGHIYLMKQVLGAYPLYASIAIVANVVFLLAALINYTRVTNTKSRKGNEMAMASLTFWSYTTLIFATQGLAL